MKNKVVKSKVDRADKDLVMNELVRHIKAKGDGIFSLTSLTKNKKLHPVLAQVLQAGTTSHGKFAQVVKEFAETLGLTVEVKTVFVITKRRE